MPTLPGHRHPFDPSWGTICAYCNIAPATVSIQGETDSMGFELMNACQVCADKPVPPMVGQCDWCKKENQTLSHQRDFEEGMSGPVYQVCQPCRAKQTAGLLAELEALGPDGMARPTRPTV